MFSKKLSVRQTEALVRSIKKVDNKLFKTKDPNIASIENALNYLKFDYMVKLN